MNDFNDVRILREELLGLFDRIQKIRQEIASIRRPGEANDRFATMSDELDAIVESTESATNSIMENAEAIEEVIRTLRPMVTDDSVGAGLDRVPDHIGAIFEACSFQDITGQRITKVVKTLQYIEKRVNALISVWGEDALSTVEPRDENETLPPTDERRLLNGPQLKGHGVSQTDVDAIMGDALQDHAEAPGAPVPGPPAPSPGARETSSDGDTAGKPEDAPAKPETPAKPAAAAPLAGAKLPDDMGPGLDQTDIDKLFG